MGGESLVARRRLGGVQCAAWSAPAEIPPGRAAARPARDGDEAPARVKQCADRPRLFLVPATGVADAGHAVDTPGVLRDDAMRFRLNERKAAQAAAYLLRRHAGRLPYIKLIKLLYLADRQALVETGLPITGDRMVSMPHGPVLSQILDFIAHGPVGTPIWFEYVSEPVNHDVLLAESAPTFDALSAYDRQVLDAIDAQYGAMDKWALRDLCHRLPEWKDPEGSSCPIDPADILRSEHVPEDEIRRIAEDADELDHLARAGLVVG